MDPFNRNIFTPRDIDNLTNTAVGTPRTMDVAPPAGILPVTGLAQTESRDATATTASPHAGIPTTPAGTPTATAGTSTTPAGPAPTADGYLTKLLKYVPLEVLGAYLFIESLISANVKDAGALQQWMFWTLLLSVVVAFVYMRTVLRVVRKSQIIIGGIGIAVYVFATGGWFATLDWYEQWYSTIALAVFAGLVGAIKLPNLPVAAAPADE